MKELGYLIDEGYINCQILSVWFSFQEICKQPPTASKLTHKTQLAMAAADSAGCHRDAILALASFNLSSQRLISASRDGAVKVWK
jgi:phosphoinositide-3-kinase, regulatory subunit 4